MKVTALAGGTGSAKLLRGLAATHCELTVVANVGDNAWIHGLYVCPDVDIAVYTLAGIVDSAKGWGIREDTFAALGQLGRLGEEDWFALGDKDLATHLLRTEWLKKGKTLTEVTDRLRKSLGVRARVLPATDSQVETRILTQKGELGLQEFWVRDKGRPRVNGVRYAGADESTVPRPVEDAISTADRIVICPANPVTSIGPILAVKGMRDAVERARTKVTCVSPMKGDGPFSGPAGKLLRTTGTRPDSVGVAKLYRGLIGTILIHRSDGGMVRTISNLGIECRVADTRMTGPTSERRLAREVLE